MRMSAPTKLTRKLAPLRERQSGRLLSSMSSSVGRDGQLQRRSSGRCGESPGSKQ